MPSRKNSTMLRPASPLLASIVAVTVTGTVPVASAATGGWDTDSVGGVGETTVTVLTSLLAVWPPAVVRITWIVCCVPSSAAPGDQLSSPVQLVGVGLLWQPICETGLAVSPSTTSAN